MSEAVEPSDKRGWTSFLAICNVITKSLESKHSTLLAGGGQGVKGTEFVRAFARVFEAAIEESRKAPIWAALEDAVLSARSEIIIRCPRIDHIVQVRAEDIGTAVHPRLVFDSLARCFACAAVRSNVIPPAHAALVNEFVRSRQAWESDVIEYDIVAPISGVEPPPFNRVEIADGLSLAWGHEVLTEGSMHQVETYRSTPIGPQPFTYLAGRTTVKKTDNPDSALRRAVADVTRCVTAMRLAIGKTIGCDTVHVVPSGTYFQTFNGLFNFVARVGETAVYRDNSLMSTQLQESDAEEARTIASLLSGEAAKELTIAIERFNLAMGRATLEDEVIDLAIALESTICRGGGAEQLSYRFRLFGAAVLADGPDAEHAMKLLGSLYNTRSRIVHAGMRLSEVAQQKELKKLFPNSTVSGILDVYRELARRILLEFLHQAAQGRSPDAYVRAMESVMVRKAKESVREEGP